MYLFLEVGDNEKNPVVTTSALNGVNSNYVFHNPREAKNIQLQDEIQNLSSINDMKVEDLTNERQPQLYLACGRGANSSLRVLRHGLTVIEMVVS